MEVQQAQSSLSAALGDRNSQMATDYLDNKMSLSQLAAKYGLSRQRISQLFQKMGVATRPSSVAIQYRLPVRDHEKIANRAGELGSVRQAAEEFGLTIGQVAYALSKTEQSVYQQKFRDAAVKEQIIADYKAGEMTLNEIGEKFGTSAQYINTILRRAGVAGARKRGRRAAKKVVSE